MSSIPSLDPPDASGGTATDATDAPRRASNGAALVKSFRELPSSALAAVILVGLVALIVAGIRAAMTWILGLFGIAPDVQWFEYLFRGSVPWTVLGIAVAVVTLAFSVSEFAKARRG